MFRLIADQHRKATERKLGLLLHDCIQIPRVLGELAAFGGSNVDPSVKSCFEKATGDKNFIEVLHNREICYCWASLSYALSYVIGCQLSRVDETRAAEHGVVACPSQVCGCRVSQARGKVQHLQTVSHLWIPVPMP